MQDATNNGAPTPETVETNSELTQQLQACVTEKDEWRDRALRMTADFENYKRRADKEKMMWISSAQSSILTDILSIVDDFDRAFSQEGNQSNQGFVMIYKSLQKMLEKYGVEEIKEVSQFDPLLHEAISQVTDENHQSGQIVKVFEKGYRFKGQVLRPAKVSVAQ